MAQGAPTSKNTLSPVRCCRALFQLYLFVYRFDIEALILIKFVQHFPFRIRGGIAAAGAEYSVLRQVPGTHEIRGFGVFLWQDSKVIPRKKG